jgi:hypothetical protein
MAGAWVESDLVSAVNLNEKAIENTYPVGSIYMNASNSTNPATLLGVGTWQRFGQGRVLVSQDSTDADFDTAGKTGGEKEHQLTEAEMPAHSHLYGDLVSKTDYGADNRGTFSIFRDGSNYDTDSTGGNQPHNNLQPYITVYMWVRTA